MENILNLTQHIASPEQKKVGVVEPQDKEKVKNLLTFDTLPSHIGEVKNRASQLTGLALEERGLISGDCKSVMIGGAPFLMQPLVDCLKDMGLEPVFAFSTRESVEKEINGEVVKTSKFLHKGFIKA